MRLSVLDDDRAWYPRQPCQERIREFHTGASVWEKPLSRPLRRRTTFLGCAVSNIKRILVSLIISQQTQLNQVTQYSEM